MHCLFLTASLKKMDLFLLALSPNMSVSGFCGYVRAEFGQARANFAPIWGDADRIWVRFDRLWGELDDMWGNSVSFLAEFGPGLPDACSILATVRSKLGETQETFRPTPVTMAQAPPALAHTWPISIDNGSTLAIFSNVGIDSIGAGQSQSNLAYF